MATGWGYGLDQIPSAAQVPNHQHFQKQSVRDPGQKGMKLRALSKMVRFNRKLERIPGSVRKVSSIQKRSIALPLICDVENDTSVIHPEPYFQPPAALLPE